MCFGLCWGFGDKDLGDIEFGECSGELIRGGDGIEKVDKGLKIKYIDV